MSVLHTSNISVTDISLPLKKSNTMLNRPQVTARLSSKARRQQFCLGEQTMQVGARSGLLGIIDERLSFCLPLCQLGCFKRK